MRGTIDTTNIVAASNSVNDRRGRPASATGENQTMPGGFPRSRSRPRNTSSPAGGQSVNPYSTNPSPLRHRRSASSTRQAASRELTGPSSESLSQGWEDVDQQPYYAEMIEGMISSLEESVKEAVPADLKSHLRDTHAPHAIAMLIGWLSGLIAPSIGRQSSLLDKTENQLSLAANRFLMKLPRPLTARDWHKVYSATIATPAFARRAKSLSPEAQNNLSKIKNLMIKVMSGEDMTPAYISIKENHQEDVNLDSMKNLFARYSLIFNMPTEHKVVDFTDIIPEPESAEMKQVAASLTLTGRTRFDAMLHLQASFPDVPLFKVFDRHLVHGKLSPEMQDSLRGQGLDRLTGNQLRSQLTLLRGEGGVGKTTLARAVAIVLGIDFFNIEPDELTVPNLIGPLTDHTTRHIPDRFEVTFGNLAVILMKARHLDVVINFDNWDLDMFVPDDERYTTNLSAIPEFRPGNTPASLLQSVLDKPIMDFKSLGKMPLDLRGVIMFGSTNKEWPDLPAGSNAQRELNAFISRIDEVNVDLSAEEKRIRLNRRLDEFGVPPDSSVRDYVDIIVLQGGENKLPRHAIRAIDSARSLTYMNTLTRRLQPVELKKQILDQIKKDLKSGQLPDEDAQPSEAMQQPDHPHQRQSMRRAITSSVKAKLHKFNA